MTVNRSRHDHPEIHVIHLAVRLRPFLPTLAYATLTAPDDPKHLVKALQAELPA